MPLTHTFSNRHRQRGVALVMAIVFLMLLTILGVTSMSMSSLEEKMATNTRDRNLAFHAAETALVAGEAWLNSLVGAEPAYLTTPVAAKGTYLPSAVVTPNWETAGIWDSANVVSYPCHPGDATPNDSGSCTSASRPQVPKVLTQPKYIIERMEQVSGAAPAPLQIAYRITARGTGGSNASVVMLQSSYIKQY